MRILAKLSRWAAEYDAMHRRITNQRREIGRLLAFIDRLHEAICIEREGAICIEREGWRNRLEVAERLAESNRLRAVTAEMEER